MWKTLYENNIKNKDKIKKDLSFGVDLYKDLGTKDINLDKGSKDYFPYKIDDRNGIVSRIDSAEEINEDNSKKVENKRYGNNIKFYVDGNEMYSLGIVSKKNKGYIYKYTNNGKKELIKGAINRKNLENEFTNISVEYKNKLIEENKNIKKGIHFKQTPIYNMYTGRSIEDGKVFEYTNYDAYENALEYATKYNHSFFYR